MVQCGRDEVNVNVDREKRRWTAAAAAIRYPEPVEKVEGEEFDICLAAGAKLSPQALFATC
jgi:hypothetical protein